MKTHALTATTRFYRRLLLVLLVTAIPLFARGQSGDLIQRKDSYLDLSKITSISSEPLPEWSPPKGKSPLKNDLIKYDVESGVTRKIVFDLQPDSILVSDMIPGFPPDVSIIGDNDNEISSAQKNFSDLVLIPNPEEYPDCVNVKVITFFPSNTTQGSGVLIDSKHVLTAGHVVYYNPYGGWADSVWVFPAYDSGKIPYGGTGCVALYSWPEWVDNENFQWDMGFIELNRPVGCLTGWHGYAYSPLDIYYTINLFHNLGYPASAPYDGERMYYWGGFFDEVNDDVLYIYRGGYGGQSGSGAYINEGESGRYVYAVLSHRIGDALTAFTRMNMYEFEGITTAISGALPTEYDLIPLAVKVEPSDLILGDQLTKIQYYVHNYSKAVFADEVNARVYLSEDEDISSLDYELGTSSFIYTFGDRGTARVTATSNLPVIPDDIDPGDYYIGISLDNFDYNYSNNTTGKYDVYPVHIEAGLPRPVIETAVDAGTADKIYLKWSHPEPDRVTSYEVCLGENPGDPTLRCETMSNLWDDYTFDNLTEHADYYVSVRAFSETEDIWSEFAEEGPLRPTVPVFLVHGLGDKAQSWNYIHNRLVADSFTYVYSVDVLAPCGYPGERHFTDNAQNLDFYIENKLFEIRSRTGFIPIDSIDIVGHSMGGLISRRYISEHESNWVPKNVRHLIMLGSPNKGSELSDIPGAWFKCPGGDAVFELSRDEMLGFNQDYPDNPNTDYYSFWGAGGLLLDCWGGIPGSFIQTPNDGAVSRNSAIRSLLSFDDSYPVYQNNLGMLWCHPEFFNDEWLYDSYIKKILRGVSVWFPSNKQEFPDVDTLPDLPPQIAFQQRDTITAGQEVSGGFFVEPNNSLTVAVFSTDTLVSFSMLSPGGETFDSTLGTTDTLQFYYQDAFGARGFHIANAVSGLWQWTVSTDNSAPSPVEYLVQAVIDNSVTFVVAQSSEYVKVGHPLVLQASLAVDGIPLTDASVTALAVWNRVDTSDIIVFADDGLHGDAEAGDGIYGTIFENSDDTDAVAFFIEATDSVDAIGTVSRRAVLYGYYQSDPEAVDDDDIYDNTLPDRLELGQNYPNPFNSGTTIRFALPRTGFVELMIYNILGEVIAVPLRENRAAGIHQIEWDGKTSGGKPVASGIYFYRLTFGETVLTKNMILLK